MVYFRTHYYGGIKKYQWPTIPLALIGVIYTRDGKKVEINVGMKEGDPIFYVSDLLIHMAQDQMKKPLAEGITGEQLQAIAWTNAEGKAKPKEVFMKWLKDTYGIEEEDFATAELELVPATRAGTWDLTAPSSLPTARMTGYAPMPTWKPSSMPTPA